MKHPRTDRILTFALLASMLPLAGCGQAGDQARQQGIQRLLFVERQAGQGLSRRVLMAGHDRVDQVEPLVGQADQGGAAIARVR